MIRPRKNNDSLWVGERFERWTVLKAVQVEIGYSTSWHWFCECDCGARQVVQPYHLKKGLSKSCGCSRIGEKRRKRARKPSKTPFVWRGKKRAAAQP